MGLKLAGCYLDLIGMSPSIGMHHNSLQVCLVWDKPMLILAFLLHGYSLRIFYFSKRSILSLCSFDLLMPIHLLPINSLPAFPPSIWPASSIVPTWSILNWVIYPQSLRSRHIVTLRCFAISSALSGQGGWVGGCSSVHHAMFSLSTDRLHTASCILTMSCTCGYLLVLPVVTISSVGVFVE